MQPDNAGKSGDDSRAIRPLARTNNLISTEANDEVLVYDQTRHQIHHLNAIVAAVWRLCNGRRTVLEIAREADIEEATVRLGLRKLANAALLESGFDPGPDRRQDRRSFLRKAGIAAIPAIVSITAPSAKAAASGGSGNDDLCESDRDCLPGQMCYLNEPFPFCA